MTIREFKVSVDESKIDDLYKRIDLTRWPDEVNDEIWTLGTKKSFLKDAVQYWRNDFDWKIHEKQINDFGIGVGFETKSSLDQSSQTEQKVIQRALRNTFAPEFLNLSLIHI